MPRNLLLAALLLPNLGLATDIPLPLDPETRPWVGPHFWANPMEDWQLENGSAKNSHSGGDRNLAVLTAELTPRHQPFTLTANFSPLASQSQNGFVGFQAGLQGNFHDYRDSAVYGTGFAAGLAADGHLFIGSFRSDKPMLNPAAGEFRLTLNATPTTPDRYDISLTASPANNPADPITLTNPGVHASWLPGLVAFTVSNLPPRPTAVRQPRPDSVPAIPQQRGGDWRFSITGISASGPKFDHHPDRAFGPILWTQHSLHNGTLILTAQFTPVDSDVPASLEIAGRTLKAHIHPQARLARFVVDDLPAAAAHPYTVRWKDAAFSATLRPEPIHNPQLTVAALSCNDSTGFPHNPLVQNLTDQMPDLIAFLGDQLYEPIGGYGHLLGPDNAAYDDRTAISYLRKFYMHGWSWGPLLSEIPSVTIPDDHDVLHGNYWGQGGKLADRSIDLGAGAQDSGGYKLAAEVVNVVHLTQTGNLPPHTDNAPAKNNISVYFTRWQYAGIDIAIVSDRQFKSAPRAILPDAKIVNGWPQNHDFQHPNLNDPFVFDVDGAELLGPRQENFLTAWAADRSPRDTWRILFSQSPFACVHTLPADAFSDAVVPQLPILQPGEYPENDTVKVDFDANGWPQRKRNLAVESITRAGAIHVAGDQHLGMTGQYGLHQHDDAAWWIATPAIANLWPRRWMPQTPGENPRPGDPPYTGRFLDGFGNKVTVHAVANPVDTGRLPARLFNRAVGYTILSLHRESRHITIANWPYTAGPNAEDNTPYPGWPITIDPTTHRRIK